jgi:hypothetical protein
MKRHGALNRSHEQHVRDGKQGGSPLLLALRRGKKITIDGKRYIPKSK